MLNSKAAAIKSPPEPQQQQQLQQRTVNNKLKYNIHKFIDGCYFFWRWAFRLVSPFCERVKCRRGFHAYLQDIVFHIVTEGKKHSNNSIISFGIVEAFDSIETLAAKNAKYVINVSTRLTKRMDFPVPNIFQIGMIKLNIKKHTHIRNVTHRQVKREFDGIGWHNHLDRYTIRCSLSCISANNFWVCVWREKRIKTREIAKCHMWHSMQRKRMTQFHYDLRS